jgi:hypothetical protein
MIELPVVAIPGREPVVAAKSRDEAGDRLKSST